MSPQAASRLVIALAAATALAGARPYAGGWNDGSRLATVESLVDRGTLAIDDSIFVRVPPGPFAPYPPDQPLLLQRGTLDKLQVGGRFLSDKPPVPAVLMAGLYAVLKAAVGLEAARQPGVFCWLMTVAFAGVPYVAGVACFGRLAAIVLGPSDRALAVTASLAFATVAPVYTRYVNGHILLFGILSALTLVLVRLGQAGLGSPALLLGAGCLAGSGYAVDPGLGPLLLLLTLAVVWYRAGPAVALFGLGAAPFVLLHHVLNFRIGGTLLPANMRAEYLAWPGSPFDVSNLTGPIGRSGVLHTLRYAMGLLADKKGFLWHDPALLLPLMGLAALAAALRRKAAGWPEGLWAAALAAGALTLYALTSTNASGLCLSIRWFVPLLAPGYLLVALVLRERPAALDELLVLSACGCAIAVLAFPAGPWTGRMVPGLWPVLALGLLGLALVKARRGAPSAPDPGHG